MDGGTQTRSGHPTVTFFEGSIPILGMTVSKSSQSTTSITGSTAAREMLPPHIQFSSSDKSEDHVQIWLEAVQFMKDMRGKFGHDVVQSFPCTFGLNKKGEMDKEEFETYLFISIAPLYPNAADVAGKRVCIKLDSGPG